MSEGSLFSRLSKMKVLGASIFGAIIIFVAGIVFWGGFNTAMEATNTMEFCVSCHEMDQAVYPEYQETIHYKNRTGVQATCPDCHVPRPWIYKIQRKIQASNEVFHWLLGDVNTLDKFETKRLSLAKNVWKAMKESDSRECRNCHSWDAMTDKKQKKRAWKQHSTAKAEGMTCIDCHKGIAHRNVHQLVEDEATIYDGEDDLARLDVLDPRKEKIRKEAEAVAKAAADKAAAEKAAADAIEKAKADAEAAAKAAAASGGSTAAAGSINWAAVTPVKVPFFYPGQASMEWIYRGKDHGGSRAVRKSGDRCTECHGNEQLDMGAKIVGGEKAEPTPIPGKRNGMDAEIQTAHDGSNFYVRVSWADTAHTPAPFADGGKMDKDNQIKLAMMIAPTKEDFFGTQAGCWATCHIDSRYMPVTPEKPEGDATARLDLKDGVTKYLNESRTEFNYKGRRGARRGAWDMLKTPEELDALLKDGTFLDLMRFKSGNGGSFENGYVLEQRVMDKGIEVTGSAELKDGKWTVVMQRPLASSEVGDVSFEAGQEYIVGFAIHDDFTNARFHHVSLELKMQLDNAEAELNVVKQ